MGRRLRHHEPQTTHVHVCHRALRLEDEAASRIPETRRMPSRSATPPSQPRCRVAPRCLEGGPENKHAHVKDECGGIFGAGACDRQKRGNLVRCQPLACPREAPNASGKHRLKRLPTTMQALTTPWADSRFKALATRHNMCCEGNSRRLCNASRTWHTSRSRHPRCTCRPTVGNGALKLPPAKTALLDGTSMNSVVWTTGARTHHPADNLPNRPAICVPQTDVLCRLYTRKQPLLPEYVSCQLAEAFPRESAAFRSLGRTLHSFRSSGRAPWASRQAVC